MKNTLTKIALLSVEYSAIFALICQFAGAHRPQEIILYSEDNFTGKQKSFISTADLSTDSIGKIAKSHCVVRGLWRINGTFKINPPINFVENAFGDEKNGMVCGTWNKDNKTAQYRSIHPIGALDLDSPAINFNTESRFFGNKELYFDGTLLRLPEPLKFKSFGFTGKENWTVYSKPDLSGFSECLTANVDPLGDYGVTFNMNKSLVVGSIWRGCGPDTGDWRKEPENGNGNVDKPSRPGKKDKNSGSKPSIEFLIWTIALLSPTSFLLL